MYSQINETQSFPPIPVINKGPALLQPYELLMEKKAEMD